MLTMWGPGGPVWESSTKAFGCDLCDKSNVDHAMKHLRALAFLLSLFLSVSMGWAAVPMPPFSLPAAVDGAMVASETYRGKALIVTFFATWCASCLQEIPTFKELHRKYESRGFSVVALSLDESGAVPVAQLMQRAGINYPVLMADGSTTKSFGGIVSVPTSFLVNKEGHVVKKYPGFVPLPLLEKDILAVL